MARVALCRAVRQTSPFTSCWPSLSTRCCGWRHSYFFEGRQLQQFRRIHFVHQIELSLVERGGGVRFALNTCPWRIPNYATTACLLVW